LRGVELRSGADPPKTRVDGSPGAFRREPVQRDDRRAGKPAPDLFLYAAQSLGVTHRRCLVTEDSPAGIDAAIAAGMTEIGFSGEAIAGSIARLGCGPTARRWSLPIRANWCPAWQGSAGPPPKTRPNLLARSEPTYADVRRRRLEKALETPDRRRRPRLSLSFPVCGRASSTPSIHIEDRKRR